MIIIDANELAGARFLAERIRLSVEASSFVKARTTISFTVSIGISVYKIHGIEIQKLIKYADLGLYTAKSSGRNRIHSVVGGDS
jgi:diguanylate cyclase (GGDEF)-like protein